MGHLSGGGAIVRTPPTSMEVIGAQTLNFRPKCKCLQLNFFSGDPSPLGCALGSVGQSLTHVKIGGTALPNGRNVVSRKMSTWVGQYEPL